MSRWGGEEKGREARRRAGRPRGLGQERYFGAGISPSAAIVLGVENPFLTPSPRAENSSGWSPWGLDLGPMSD